MYVTLHCKSKRVTEGHHASPYCIPTTNFNKTIFSLIGQRILPQLSTAAELLRRNVLPSIAYICGRQRCHFPKHGPNANAGPHRYNVNPRLPHKHNKETNSQKLLHVVTVVCLPMLSVTSYYAASTCRMTDLQKGAVVPKLLSADPKGSATCSQMIHGYISVTTTSTFTFLIKGIMFC
jgi:hypothetical protein